MSKIPNSAIIFRVFRGICVTQGNGNDSNWFSGGISRGISRRYISKIGLILIFRIISEEEKMPI